MGQHDAVIGLHCSQEIAEKHVDVHLDVGDAHVVQGVRYDGYSLSQGADIEGRIPGVYRIQQCIY